MWKRRDSLCSSCLIFHTQVRLVLECENGGELDKILACLDAKHRSEFSTSDTLSFELGIKCRAHILGPGCLWFMLCVIPALEMEVASTTSHAVNRDGDCASLHVAGNLEWNLYCRRRISAATSNDTKQQLYFTFRKQMIFNCLLKLCFAKIKCRFNAWK